MKRTSLALVLCCLAGCRETPTAPVVVEDAMVSLPAVPGRPGALYFTARTDQPQMRLVSITSPRVARIELHHSMTENGRSRMMAMAPPAFSSRETLRFAPGGRHAMLFDLDPAAKAGERIAFTFRFEPAGPVNVEAEIRAPGDVHEGH